MSNAKFIVTQRPMKYNKASTNDYHERLLSAMKMKTKRDLIQYCLTYPDVYEDYPFHDTEWAVIRHRKNKKVFAWIYTREDQVCVNVKCDPEWTEFWRNAFPGVLPGYHLNKKYWNTILLDGTVPDEDVKRMIGESYDLTREKR